MTTELWKPAVPVQLMGGFVSLPNTGRLTDIQMEFRLSGKDPGRRRNREKEYGKGK